MSCPSAGPAGRHLDTSITPVHPAQMTPEASRDASLATWSKMEVITTKDSCQEVSDQQPFQIFPGSAEVPLGLERVLSSGDPKETLPSIVVEPTYLSPLENGDHCWPPEGTASQDEEEDILQELYTSPSHLIDRQGEREEQECAGNEEGSPNKGGVQRRQSNPLATAELSCSRLTLPTVSQSPEEMPPCLRSRASDRTSWLRQKTPPFLPSHDL